MASGYKITATIIKPGEVPITWTRFTRGKMTNLNAKRCFLFLIYRVEPPGNEILFLWRISVASLWIILSRKLNDVVCVSDQ
ncbi:TPA: DUF1187 family protein [Escherichia coli]